MQVPVWKFAAATMLLFFLYVGSYLAFRGAHQEVGPHDSKVYVIFPSRSRALYYFFRPLTYVDGTLTDMQFHIGHH